MDATPRPVLTIGHSTHPLEAFVALLRRYEVAKVMDVRSRPYSRFNPQFNREMLARNLTVYGIKYTFLGVEWGGGRSDDPSCYEAAMERLLAIHGGAQQGELFASPGDRVNWAVATQAKRIGYKRRGQDSLARR